MAVILNLQSLYLQISKSSSTLSFIIKNITDEELEATSIKLGIRKIMHIFRKLDMIIPVMADIKDKVISTILISK